MLPAWAARAISALNLEGSLAACLLPDQSWRRVGNHADRDIVSERHGMECAFTMLRYDDSVAYPQRGGTRAEAT
jgi:hypothetical protein